MTWSILCNLFFLYNKKRHGRILFFHTYYLLLYSTRYTFFFHYLCIMYLFSSKSKLDTLYTRLPSIPHFTSSIRKGAWCDTAISTFSFAFIPVENSFSFLSSERFNFCMIRETFLFQKTDIHCSKPEQYL